MEEILMDKIKKEYMQSVGRLGEIQVMMDSLDLESIKLLERVKELNIMAGKINNEEQLKKLKDLEEKSAKPEESVAT